MDQRSQHLLAERVLDQQRLVRPLGPEDLAEPLGFGFDIAAGEPSRGGVV
ncbi:hypothetical protein ACFV4J_45545 [Streptomyces mirabilis]